MPDHEGSSFELYLETQAVIYDLEVAGETQLSFDEDI